jgi:hypothetical protein
MARVDSWLGGSGFLEERRRRSGSSGEDWGMGKFKYLLAIAVLGMASFATAQARVVTFSDGNVDATPWTSVDADPNPSDAAMASFTYSDAIDSANGAGGRRDEIEENGSSSVFGLELPEVSTWAMMGLGFAALGFAAFRSPRKREISTFS